MRNSATVAVCLQAAWGHKTCINMRHTCRILDMPFASLNAMGNMWHIYGSQCSLRAEAHRQWSVLSTHADKHTHTHIERQSMLSKCTRGFSYRHSRCQAFGLAVITAVTRAGDKSQINQHSQTWQQAEKGRGQRKLCLGGQPGGQSIDRCLPNASQGAPRCRRPCASFGMTRGLFPTMMMSVLVLIVVVQFVVVVAAVSAAVAVVLAIVVAVVALIAVASCCFLCCCGLSWLFVSLCEGFVYWSINPFCLCVLA